MAIFITGTNTDIGKTTIAAWLCLHTGITYWKPIQSGSSSQTDTKIVQKLAGVTTLKEVYLLKAPLSPHAAALKEGITIDTQQLSLPAIKSLIIEGAGGVLVPLNQDVLLIDLLKFWEIPVIIVASSKLGTINHTCLTIEALRMRHIPILGVIMNGTANLSNKRAIEKYGNVNVLAEFPQLKECTKAQLLSHPLPKKLLKALSSL